MANTLGVRPALPHRKFSLSGGWGSPCQPWACHTVAVQQIFAHLGILGAPGQEAKEPLGPFGITPFEEGEARRGEVDSKAIKPWERVAGAGPPTGVCWSECAAGSERPALVIVTS